MKKESKTQKAIVSYLAYVLPVPYLLVKVDNEGRQGQTNGLVAEGYYAGAADLILQLPATLTPSTVWLEVKTVSHSTRRVNGTRFSELKTQSTKQRASQKAFEEHVKALGQTYWLVESLDTLGPLVEGLLRANGLKSRIVSRETL